MEKLDPSTKKQLSLLMAKTSSAPKTSKPIVSTVPLAQIRKAMLKDHSEVATNASEMPSSPINRTKSASPIRSTEKLSPSKSTDSLFSSAKKISPSKSTNSVKLTKSSPSKSPSKLNVTVTETTSLSVSEASLIEPTVINVPTAECTDVPMDEIQIPPMTPVLCSPSRSVKDLIKTFDRDPQGSPMKIDSQSCDVFMDAQSGDILADAADDDDAEEDGEIILNISNVQTLTEELPKKLELGKENNARTPLKHSISSPSIPLRIKTLGLAAGTPLRAIYRNASEMGLPTNQTLNVSESSSFSFSSYSNSNSLLSDLIEEFTNTKDETCFKKILSLTSSRTGDFDGLTSDLISKLFQNLLQIPFELKLNLLTNFLRNESFLLSNSGKEIIEILEESQESSQQNVKLLINSICQSNLSQILLENCIEMCCERLSEFKLILLAEFVKNYVGSFDDFKDQLQRSIAPLLLVSIKVRKLEIILLIFRL